MIRFLWVVVLGSIWGLIVALLTIALSPILYPIYGVNMFMARVVSWGFMKIAGIQLEIRGTENIPKDHFCVVTLNHQSSLDFITFASVAPLGMAVIGKKELAYIPIIGLLWILGRNLSIDRSNRGDSIHKFKTAAKIMSEKKLLVAVCPEGTRNWSGEGLLPFKKGAFHLAIQAQAPVTPAVCTQVKRVFDFRGKKVPGGKLIVEFLPPIPTKGMEVSNADSVCTETRSKMLAKLELLEKEIRISA